MINYTKLSLLLILNIYEQKYWNRIIQYQIVNETRHFAKSIIKYHTIANLAEVVYYYYLI